MATFPRKEERKKKKANSSLCMLWLYDVLRCIRQTNKWTWRRWWVKYDRECCVQVSTLQTVVVTLSTMPWVLCPARLVLCLMAAAAASPTWAAVLAARVVTAARQVAVAVSVAVDWHRQARAMEAPQELLLPVVAARSMASASVCHFLLCALQLTAADICTMFAASGSLPHDKSQRTRTHLTALWPWLLRWAGTRKVKNQSGFYWSRRQWVAVASAGLYTSLHLAPDW